MSTDTGQPGSGNGSSDEQIQKLRFDYAWKFFEFHAKQRTTMYNFFLVFSAIIITAQMKLISMDDSASMVFLVALSILGILMTVFFIFLDRRNEELVRCAEMVLKILEKEYIFKGYKFDHVFKYRNILGWPKIDDRLCEQLGILTDDCIQLNKNDVKPVGRFNYSHGRWLPITQVLIILAFAFLASTPWTKQIFPEAGAAMSPSKLDSNSASETISQEIK